MTIQTGKGVDTSSKKKELLRKIRKLAEQGVGGEKESAKRIYESLLKKYDVLESDLDDDTKKEHAFRFRDLYEKQLIIQIIYKTIKKPKVYYCTCGKGSKSTLYCECTKAESIQIGVEYDFYKQLWKDDLETFFEAFIYKHNIFSAEPPEDTMEKPCDKEKLSRMARLIMGMKDVHFHPRIGG